MLARLVRNGVLCKHFELLHQGTNMTAADVPDCACGKTVIRKCICSGLRHPDFCSLSSYLHSLECWACYFRGSNSSTVSHELQGISMGRLPATAGSSRWYNDVNKSNKIKVFMQFMNLHCRSGKTCICRIKVDLRSLLANYERLQKQQQGKVHCNNYQ